jgi:hypothetical protein
VCDIRVLKIPQNEKGLSTFVLLANPVSDGKYAVTGCRLAQLVGNTLQSVSMILNQKIVRGILSHDHEGLKL